jgi:hypothetical protein
MRRHLTYANVVATLALVFAMAGGAVAANHYLINSTSQINPKVIKKLKAHNGKAGATGKTGATGSAGSAGAPGAPGAPGANATNLWARVNFKGELILGSGVASAKLVEPPSGYEVIFNRNVRACAYEATIASAALGETALEGDNKGPGQIKVEPLNENKNGVWISTSNSKGEEAANSFHLAVFC